MILRMVGGDCTLSPLGTPPVIVSPQDVVSGLTIIVNILLVIVLYHLLFLMVDLRKIVQRIEGLTQELEAVILKPLSLTDKLFGWLQGFLEEKEGNPRGRRHRKKS